MLAMLLEKNDRFRGKDAEYFSCIYVESICGEAEGVEDINMYRTLACIASLVTSLKVRRLQKNWFKFG